MHQRAQSGALHAAARYKTKLRNRVRLTETTITAAKLHSDSWEGGGRHCRIVLSSAVVESPCRYRGASYRTTPYNTPASKEGSRSQPLSAPFSDNISKSASSPLLPTRLPSSPTCQLPPSPTSSRVPSSRLSASTCRWICTSEATEDEERAASRAAKGAIGSLASAVEQPLKFSTRSRSSSSQRREHSSGSISVLRQALANRALTV